MRKVRRRRPFDQRLSAGTVWYDARPELREAAGRLYGYDRRADGPSFADLPPSTKGAYVRAVKAVAEAWPDMEAAARQIAKDDAEVNGNDRLARSASACLTALAEAHHDARRALRALRAGDRRSARRFLAEARG